MSKIHHCSHTTAQENSLKKHLSRHHANAEVFNKTAQPGNFSKLWNVARPVIVILAQFILLPTDVRNHINTLIINLDAFSNDASKLGLLNKIWSLARPALEAVTAIKFIPEKLRNVVETLIATLDVLVIKSLPASTSKTGDNKDLEEAESEAVSPHSKLYYQQ